MQVRGEIGLAFFVGAHDAAQFLPRDYRRAADRDRLVEHVLESCCVLTSSGRSSALAKLHQRGGTTSPIIRANAPRNQRPVSTTLKVRRTS